MQVNNLLAGSEYVDKGRLATFREYPYKKDKHIRVSVNGKYHSTALVEKVLTQPSHTTIRRYLSISGFSSVEKWIETAKTLNKGRMPDYLVIIKRI